MLGETYLELAALLAVIASIVFGVMSALKYSKVQEKESEIKAEAVRLQNRELELDRDKRDIVEQADAKKREFIVEAKDEVHRIRAEVDGEVREKRAEIQRMERRVIQKEEVLDHRLQTVEQHEKVIIKKEVDTDKRYQAVEDLYQQQYQELQRVAQMSVEEARTLFLKRIEDEARQDASRLVRNIEDEAKRDADRRAREIVIDTIQRNAVEYVSESSVSVVELPNDEMKGRIIGREGRNIRTFEQILGVDLIIDDTPEAVVLSCFDPIRREVARIALLNLVIDGRIHPARIEEAVEKAQEEVDRQMLEAGERGVLKAGLVNLHPELVKQMGRLRFRTSYGQNVLAHSIEVSVLATQMATELHADVELARRAAFLHDIAKSLSSEVEGTHALLGMQLIKKFGESDAVANAVGAHHSEIEPETVEAVLVSAADSISAARPGARRESLESYVRRLEKLEEIAESFKGVEKSYAVQAGREVRIIVKPVELDDLGAVELARDVAKRIEEELEYPGQIKVTVIRETRSQSYAK